MIERITNQNQIARHKLAEKINEFVDKVNDLTTNLDGQARTLVELQAKVSMLEEQIHPTATTEPTDPYAEQRKWVGKLCWFWDGDKEDKICDILSHINNKVYAPYVQCDHQISYIHCEPVKADDDIIYKGE